MSVWTVIPIGTPEALARQLLAKDGRGQVQPLPAVLFRIGQAEHAEVAIFLEEIMRGRYSASLLDVRVDLLLDEAPHHLAGISCSCVNFMAWLLCAMRRGALSSAVAMSASSYRTEAMAG
jgi:hypothetical protein